MGNGSITTSYQPGVGLALGVHLYQEYQGKERVVQLAGILYGIGAGDTWGQRTLFCSTPYT